MGRGLTKRAPDVWDSAAFSSIFLASSFSCSQAESQPAHNPVTQTVERLPRVTKGIYKMKQNVFAILAIVVVVVLVCGGVSLYAKSVIDAAPTFLAEYDAANLKAKLRR